MKRIIVTTLVSLGLSLGSAPALAFGDYCKAGQKTWWVFCKDPTPPQGDDGPPTTVAAPEIDAGSATLAIGLLVAGVLLVAEGLRRRR